MHILLTEASVAKEALHNCPAYGSYEENNGSPVCVSGASAGMCAGE